MFKQIYNSMLDEKSKHMYLYRLLQYITGDSHFFVKMISLNEICSVSENEIKLSDWYKSVFNENCEAVIWGASSSGTLRYDFNKLLGCDGIKYFVDSNSELQKNGCYGKKVLSPEDFYANYSGEPILIESKFFEDEIRKELKSHLPSGYKIIKHTCIQTQYFDDILQFDDEEIFLDCGCYDCGTIKDFISATNGSYSKIIAFEPEKANYNNCIKIINANHWKNINIINKGLWDKRTTLNIVSSNGSLSSSKIIEDEDKIRYSSSETKSILGNIDRNFIEFIPDNALDINKVDVVDIDSVVGDDKVTFIKMDIEGSELKALKGARNTISKNKPKLAICIYHKPEDIVEIPAYLKELVPEYKFVVRHYSERHMETVLYAVI